MVDPNLVVVDPRGRAHYLNLVELSQLGRAVATWSSSFEISAHYLNLVELSQPGRAIATWSSYRNLVELNTSTWSW
ncbi:MAG: hypothetical protein R3B48_21920 [Kofleriaceae bacterium]